MQLWKGKTTVSKKEEDSLTGNKNDDLQNSCSHCRSNRASVETVSMGGCYRNHRSTNQINRGKLARTCWHSLWGLNTNVCVKRCLVGTSWWVVYQLNKKSHPEFQKKRGVNLMRGKQMLKLQKADPSFSFCKS